jgi:hypothetical protein
MALQITSSGSFQKTDAFLSHLSKGDIYKSLDTYARRGVEALKAATPADSGVSGESWGYEIENDGKNVTIRWTNNHLDEEGTPVVVLLQFGHGTGTGGYVQGRDFINPAIAPIFQEIKDAVWKEVTSS